MAEYILQILKSNLMIVFSWGFYNPQQLSNGLKFNVEGFKYKGEVKVIYNEATDLFDITLENNTKVDDVYADNLVNVIDNLVEKTDDYKERITQKYNIHF